MGWLVPVTVTSAVVVPGGPVAGVFIYNGTPGPGNPPQIAEVSSGTTTDPFGNAITSSKILMQANVITETGGIFRTAATAPLIQIDGPHNAFWIYNSGAALVVTAATAAGNDGLGNTFPGGVAVFTTVTGLFAGRYQVELNNQAQLWGATLAALTFSNLTNPGNLAPAVTAQTHATAGNNINIQSGKSTAGSTGATIQVQDSVSSSVAGGLVDVIAGKLTAILQDGNQYRTERLSLQNSANFSLATGTPATITGLSVPVVAGTYRVNLDLLVTIGGTATNLTVGMSGPAVSSDTSLKWQFYQDSTTGQSMFSGHNVGALGNTTEPGTTWPSGATVQVHMQGWITFTAAGTLAAQAAIGTASAGSQISLASHMDIMPV